jgi:phosphoenolpyruvate-protein phosphotransferase (PTS system enzyme I)
MITHLKEIAQFRVVFDEVKEDLRAEGIPFDEKVPLGIMVEVPAIALTAERFAREVDFFSIGTNDLTQYTLAVDRGNDLVADKYDELHPAVLKLIQKSVRAARLHGIPVSVCGEMAANPGATPVLIGLGVDELSASPVYLPEIKRVVRAIKLDEAQELAEKALAADDASDVRELLDAWLTAHACGLVHLMEQEPV